MTDDLTVEALGVSLECIHDFRDFKPCHMGFNMLMFNPAGSHSRAQKMRKNPGLWNHTRERWIQL